MFRTVTANPLLVTQGSHLCISQERVNDNKVVERRYVLIDSETLVATPYAEKLQFEAAISELIEAHQKPAKKANPLDALDNVEQPVTADVVADVAAEEEADDNSVQA